MNTHGGHVRREPDTVEAYFEGLRNGHLDRAVGIAALAVVQDDVHPWRHAYYLGYRAGALALEETTELARAGFRVSGVGQPARSFLEAFPAGVTPADALREVAQALCSRGRFDEAAIAKSAAERLSSRAPVAR